MTIHLKPGFTAGYNRLAVLTEIQIFDEERLSIDESGITAPLILGAIEPMPDKEIIIKLQYKIDAVPGLKYCINYC